MPTLIIVRITVLFFISGLAGPASKNLQETDPDKFINFIKKQDESVAFTLPGWLIRKGGKISTSEMSDSEAAVVRELTGNIKKLRFVVSEGLPDGFEEKFDQLKAHLTNKAYEPLIQAKDEETRVYLWAKFDGQIIKKMVITVLNADDSAVVFKIKSKIDMARLKEMKFYQKWDEL